MLPLKILGCSRRGSSDQRAATIKRRTISICSVTARFRGRRWWTRGPSGSSERSIIINISWPRMSKDRICNRGPTLRHQPTSTKTTPIKPSSMMSRCHRGRGGGATSLQISRPTGSSRKIHSYLQTGTPRSSTILEAKRLTSTSRRSSTQVLSHTCRREASRRR